MPVRYAPPRPSEPVLDASGHFTVPWQNYLRTRFGDDVANEVIAEIEAQIAALTLRVDELEDAGSAQIQGPQSVSVAGSLASGLVQLALVGDEDKPLPVSLYSTDGGGVKGWNLLFPNWIPNPYADYLVDENGDYMVDEDGNFLTAQDGFPIPLEYGGTGGDYSTVAPNLAFASPDGSSGAPIFRALEEADLPPVYDPLGSAASALSTANAYTDSVTVGLSSGVWLPTITNTTNVTSSSASNGQWSRVGDVVTFSVRIAVQAASGTAGAPVSTAVEITLPVVPNFVGVAQMCGNATIGESPYVTGQVSGNTANESANINWFATSTSNRAITITGTYRMTA